MKVPSSAKTTVGVNLNKRFAGLQPIIHLIKENKFVNDCLIVLVKKGNFLQRKSMLANNLVKNYRLI